jgi:hypothetical protein
MVNPETGDPVRFSTAGLEFVLLMSQEQYDRCTAIWVGDGSIPSVKYESLPEEAEADWAAVFTDRKSVVTSANGRSSISQHSKKFNILNSEVGYGAEKSKHWSPIKAEEVKEQKEIVFLYHDRFMPLLDKAGTQPSTGAYRNVEIIRKLNCFGDFNSLVGIRKSEKSWVEKNAEKLGLIHFSDYLLREFSNRVQNMYEITADQVEMSFLLLEVLKEAPGFASFVLGATREIDEFRDLVKPLRKPLLATFRHELYNFSLTNFGKRYAEQAGFTLRLRETAGSKYLDYNSELLKDPNVSTPKKLLLDLAERVTKTLTACAVMSAFRDPRNPDLRLTPNLRCMLDVLTERHHESKAYQLLLCLEQTGA